MLTVTRTRNRQLILLHTMDPTIKFDDFTEEEQALMKSAPYVMKPWQDWHFKDVLHFFKSSVTNEKSCIKIISEREVDGALIASMNDKEMEAGASCLA